MNIQILKVYYIMSYTLECFATKIQRRWRNYRNNQSIILLQDSMTFDLLMQCIDQYNNTIIFEKNINRQLKNKKIRQSNFPSHISENIVKFAYCKKYKIMPTWDTETGDLQLHYNPTEKIKIEVKGSINLYNGPPTFGPTEYWDIILFIDGKDTLNKNYKIFEIRLSPNTPQWEQLMVNKKETYKDQCKAGRRPRLAFKEIHNQLQNYCKVIFDGHIDSLK